MKGHSNTLKNAAIISEAVHSTVKSLNYTILEFYLKVLISFKIMTVNLVIALFFAVIIARPIQNNSCSYFIITTLDNFRGFLTFVRSYLNQ